MPERTYQTYEQDVRDPDLRTLIGVFLQGWDLNWVLTGTGCQRVAPQRVVEWLAQQKYPATDATPSSRLAEELAENYASGAFPAPEWVREELPDLTVEEAKAIVDGDWPAWAGAEASQELSGQHLMVATELADEALRGLWLPRNRYFNLVALIYDALVKGLPYAEIIAFARPAAVELAGGGSDDGGAEVDGEGAANPGRGAAAGG